MAASRPTRNASLSFSAIITIAAALIGFAMPAFVAMSLHGQHRQALQAAELGAVNTSRALEQHAARALETIDTHLQTMVFLGGPRMDNVSPLVIHEALRDRVARARNLNNILITNAAGEVVHDAMGFPVMPRDLSHRDYFQAHRDRPDAGLFVGSPILGSLTGRPTLPVARRIDNADGSFAGVIMAALDPAAFQTVYDAIKLGPAATMSLWRSDGMLLVRAPHLAEMVGKGFGSSANFKRYVQPKVTAPFWAAGSTDGVERVIALGFLESYPLYVSTALSRDTVLSEWRASAWAQAIIAGGLTLVVVVALLVLAREVRRRQIATCQIEEAERDARAASARMETLLVDAQNASRAKTDFVASMSHEIRTPLNSIIGFTDLLLRGRAHTPADRRKLEHVQAAGAALLTVVNDVLDFSKIEAGRIELDPRPFSLAALIDNGVAIVGGVAVNKNIAVRASVDPDLSPLLIGDPSRLLQILLNLLNNAVKFTSEGSVAVEAVRLGEAGGRVSLRVSVTDTGIGVPAGKLSRLFERFSQVDGSISRRYGGTGLGLAISKRLIEQMGGSIGVVSVEGLGSTFSIEIALPLADADSLGVTPSASAAGAPAPRAARILLVEDIAINQELARAVLEGAGHVVDVAANGAEAVRAVERERYDLVLMDVQMPVMDGIEATSRIRGLEGPANALPIVAMTANVLPEQVARFREAGMDDHVGKPFRPDDLVTVVARWLAPATGRADSPAWDERAAESALCRETFDDLAGSLGPDAIMNLLALLERQLVDGWPRDAGVASDQVTSNRVALGSAAHAAASAAGALGFLDLSGLCRRLEAACADQVGIDEAAGAARLARDRALDEIASLRRSLRKSAA